MTKPVHPEFSAFTVEVQFKGTFYDVEITPTLNGMPIKWLEERVGQWNFAEKTARLFSRKIEEMLDNPNIPADYSLVKDGAITAGSAEGFTFAKGLTVTHKTLDVWNEFIGCLEDPVSPTTGRPPVAQSAAKVAPIGLGALLSSIVENPYKNLTADEQRKVRSELLENNYRLHFAGEVDIDLENYTPQDKPVLKFYWMHTRVNLYLSRLFNI